MGIEVPPGPTSHKEPARPTFVPAAAAHHQPMTEVKEPLSFAGPACPRRTLTITTAAPPPDSGQAAGGPDSTTKEAANSPMWPSLQDRISS
eukprot:3764069-Amphidinium_carterae.1